MDGASIRKREKIDHAALYLSNARKRLATSATALSPCSDVAEVVPDERHRVGVQVRDHHLPPLTHRCRLTFVQYFEDYAIVAGVELAACAALPREQGELVAGV